ncbi:MAG: FG-GAP repeat protein [Planctomycetes bacterium]|nr:FG-GAP repeat protein [Planctomycetota bacterium]
MQAIINSKIFLLLIVLSIPVLPTSFAESPLRVIIDTDPAIGDSDPDDGTAIIYAFQSEECIVEGITYGYGNFGKQLLDTDGIPGGNHMLDYYQLKVNKILEVLYEAGAIENNPPVCRGHKEIEIWDNQGYPGVENPATDFIIQTVQDNPGQITVIALGTLTNIATAMAHYPGGPESFLLDCKNLWIIGGAILPVMPELTKNGLVIGNVLIDCDANGNCTYCVAEWNIWRDKEAAEYVFEHAIEFPAGLPKIHMVPLNVTAQYGIIYSIHVNNLPNTRVGNYLRFPLHWWIGQKNLLDRRQIDDIESGAILAARSANILGWSPVRPFDDRCPGFPPYDTIGIALALEPNELGLVKSVGDHKINVDILTGETKQDIATDDRKNVRIYYDIENSQMEQNIIARWWKLDQLSQNTEFIDCSKADYVINYNSNQYEGPRDVSQDFDLLGQFYYHLPIGTAPYTSIIPPLTDPDAKYRGRLFFPISALQGSLVSDLKLHIYCDTKSQDSEHKPNLDHRVNIYACDYTGFDPVSIWTSADDESNKYVGDTRIGTLQVWRTVNLGSYAGDDLQNAIDSAETYFSILLAEDGDDHSCAWFDTSVDWKAYLEVILGSTTPIGSLTVTIDPSEIRGSAKWRLTDGPDTDWKLSGDTISNISLGDYTLQFNEVSDWVKPIDSVITISQGNNSETGTYYPTVDLYEPDDTDSQANWIYDGSPQAHKIVPADDVDWVKFTLATESEVVIETSGDTGNTHMWLYDNSLNQIEYDNDDGVGSFSRIDRLCDIDALPSGVYYVKFEEAGNDDEILGYIITFTVTACGGANHTPQLSNGSVSPTSGDTNTDFYWFVDYYDEDGTVPSIKKVYIDGVAYTMRKYSGSFSNGTYIYGPERLAEGSHDYHFYFRDGSGGEIRLPTSGTYTNPIVSVSTGEPDLIATDTIVPTTDQWLPFNSVQVGGSKVATVTLTNQGQGALTVQGVPSPPQPGIWVADYGDGDSVAYSLTFPDDPDGDGEFVIQPGESQNVVVTFSPTEIGRYYEAWLKVNSNDPDYPDGFIVGLDGAGLDPSLTDIILVGEYHDNAGESLSSAGDVDRDGYDDILIGAPDADIGSGINLGRAYLVYGGPNLNPSISLISEAAFTIYGTVNYDAVGNCISSGDFNRDGFSDLAIGAYGNAVGLRVYIVYGRSDLSGTISSNNADLVLQGSSVEHTRSLSLSGDLNGDGYDDLIIGAPVRIIMGRAGLTGILNVQTNPDVMINGVSGEAATHAGDVDGDGLCDMIIDGGSPAGQGGAYLFLGRHTWVNSLDATDANCHIQAVGYDYDIGSGLAGIGDINGDGYDDLLIGARAMSSSGKGKAYIVYGRDVWPSSMLVTNADVVILGANNDNDWFGRIVDGAGDFSEDGYSDILLGALNSNINGDSSGEAYLIYGRGNLSGTITMPADADGHWTGAALTRLGYATVSAGDIDRDGRADIAISAPSAVSSAGEVYIIRGGTATPVTPPRQKPDLRILSISGDTLFSPNRQSNIYAQVENIGPGPAHSYKIGCYLSNDENFDLSDSLLGYIPMGRLPSGQVDNGHMVADCPNVPDDSYFIVACADAMNENIELDEMNNNATQLIGVDSTPPAIWYCFVGGVSGQRSCIDKISIFFNSSVEIEPNDVTVVDVNSAQSIPFTFKYLDPVLILYFGQLLPEGAYNISLDALGITDFAGNNLDGNGDGQGGDNYTYDFFCLFGDSEGDGDVDFNDLTFFTSKWLESGCSSENNYCWGVDLVPNGQIDFADFAIFAKNWLKYRISADINLDGNVNLIDFGILANQWYQPPHFPSADIAPDEGDGLVDYLDLAEIAEHWLEGTIP